MKTAPALRLLSLVLLGLVTFSTTATAQRCVVVRPRPVVVAARPVVVVRPAAVVVRPAAVVVRPRVVVRPVAVRTVAYRPARRVVVVR